MPNSNKLRLVFYLFLGQLSSIGQVHKHSPYLPAVSFQLKCLTYSLFLLRIIQINRYDVFIVLRFADKQRGVFQVRHHLEEARLYLQKFRRLFIISADGYFIVIFKVGFIYLPKRIKVLITC